MLFIIRQSLGGTTDTHPNPVLRAGNEDDEAGNFRPAYEPVEDNAERLGRDWKS
jgi:FAD synthetase